MNGQWGIQNDPYYGDVINAYNDGPVEDGSVMGPFYEIETSSPGAELAPNESLTHTQKIIHIQGNDKQLDYIIKKLFKTDIYSIYGAQNETYIEGWEKKTSNLLIYKRLCKI